MSSPQQRALQGNVQQRTSEEQIPAGQLGPPQQAPPSQNQAAPQPQTPQTQQQHPSGFFGAVEGGFNVVRSDVVKAGGFVAGEVESGIAGYEKVTQPIRNVTEGPSLGTPQGTKYSGQFVTRTQETEFGTIQKTVPIVEGTAAQGPTQQQIGRRAVFVVGGIAAGGDIVALGKQAGNGILADIGGKFGIGAAYGGATSAVKGGSPEQIAESAALSGGLFGAGPIAGKAFRGVASKLGDFRAAIRTPSTVESETGFYSGTVGGKPGLLTQAANTFRKPPPTPELQMTDLPAEEAPIRTRQFGEVFAQKKFGIEPTQEVNYEYEYGGKGKSFEYSPVEAREQVFSRSGSAAGPGYKGAGGRGGVQSAFEDQSLRTPPESPFSETEYFRTAFQDRSVDFVAPSRTSFLIPGFASVGQASSGVAVKTVLPSLSGYKEQFSTPSGSGGVRQIPSQQQQGGIARIPQGSGLGTYVQPTQQQTQPSPQPIPSPQPTPDVTVLRLSNPSPSIQAVSAPEPRPFSAAFAQPPSMDKGKRKRKALFGAREIHYPIGSLFDFSAIRGAKRKAKRK